MASVPISSVRYTAITRKSEVRASETIFSPSTTNCPYYNSIKILGAREHNLQNVDLEIPRNKLVVFTGLSGSGKSSSSGGSQGTVKTHVVKKGETLSSISRKYGCTVNDLQKWNNLKSNTVMVGQKLKIKK